MTTRGRGTISFMDLNSENPADALPQPPPRASTRGQVSLRTVSSFSRFPSRPTSFIPRFYQSSTANTHEGRKREARKDDENCEDEKEDDGAPSLHKLAKKVLSMDPIHQFHFELPTEADGYLMGDCITIVCLSDTLGQCIAVPDGDVLIHAGNLTKNGDFDEMQKMIDWLNTLPHAHKIMIAGNHDMILDEVYCDTLIENGYSGPTAQALDWGNVVYLQDNKQVLDVWVKSPAFLPTVNSTNGALDLQIELSEASGLDFGGSSTTNSKPGSRSKMIEGEQNLSAYHHRRFTIFGTPWTSSPTYSTVRYFAHSAFQTDPAHLVWSKTHDNRIPSSTNILITHGPPRFHGDCATRFGSSSLLREIHRVKPWLVVTGYHHSAQRAKVETVVLNKTRVSYEKILEEQPLSILGWARLATMTMRVMGKATRLKTEKMVRSVLRQRKKVLKVKNLTTFVNAAISLDEHGDSVEGEKNKPIVIFMKPEYEVEY